MVIRCLKCESGPKSGPDAKWTPTKRNNCKLDDLRAGFEIAEGYWLGHAENTNFTTYSEQPDCSETAN